MSAHRSPGEMTGGSSGADFYFTSDGKYICKEIKKREEMDVLLKASERIDQHDWVEIWWSVGAVQYDLCIFG